MLMGQFYFVAHLVSESGDGFAQPNLADHSQRLGIGLDESTQFGELLAHVAPSHVQLLQLNIVCNGVEGLMAEVWAELIGPTLANQCIHKGVDQCCRGHLDVQVQFADESRIIQDVIQVFHGLIF
jgi:hypothetical protein